MGPICNLFGMHIWQQVYLKLHKIIAISCNFVKIIKNCHQLERIVMCYRDHLVSSGVDLGVCKSPKVSDCGFLKIKHDRMIKWMTFSTQLSSKRNTLKKPCIPGDELENNPKNMSIISLYLLRIHVALVFHNFWDTLYYILFCFFS